MKVMGTRIISGIMALTMALSSSAPFEKSVVEDFLYRLNYVFQLFERDESASLDEETGDFYEQMASMVVEYAPESYFGKIIIDIGNNTIQKDNQPGEALSDYGIDYSTLNSVNPVVSAEALFDMLGIEGIVDRVSETLTAVIDGKKTVIDAVFSELSELSEDAKAFLTADEMEECLLLETEVIDDKIIITKKFQTKRLIVQTLYGRALGSYAGEVKRITDGEGCYVLQFDTEENTKSAYDKLSSETLIDYVVCDSVVSASALSEREGAELLQTDRFKKHLKKNGKSKKITVAVLDTGVDSNHPFLKSRMVSGYDAVADRTKVKDKHGHGTHVAGIVVDNTPSNVKIMPIKVLDDDGSGSDLTVRLGIEYAIKKKVDVINLSLGGTCEGKGCQLCAGVKKAIKAGIKVVVAAGNETVDTKTVCPAKIGDCITVASCSADTVNISNYSNYGDAVDVTAPGESILSCSTGGGYEKMSGTSMAAPFATAAVAMLLTEQSSLTVAQTEKKLKSYCADMNIKGWDKYSGEGVINFGIALGDKITAKTVNIPDEKLSMSYFSKCAKKTAEIYIEGREGKNEILTDRSFTVKSSNSKVAVFDGKFVVPKGDGKAKITVTLPNGQSDSFDVELKKKEVWIDYAASKYEKGDGSKKNPYIISNAAQLAKFALDMRKGKSFKGKYLKLSKDIDLKGKYWITACAVKIDNGWIKQGDTVFEGCFDGANHKIKNMTVFDEFAPTGWSASYVPNMEWYEGNTGFIGTLEGGTVKRLGIENGYCENAEGALLIRRVDGESRVSNCYTTGYCRGSGLFDVVVNYDVLVENCFSSATVGGSGVAREIYSSNDSRGPVIVANTFFCGELIDTFEKIQRGAFAGRILGNEETQQTYIYNCFSSADALVYPGFTEKSEYSNISFCYYNKSNSKGINVRNGSTDYLNAVSDNFFKSKKSFTSSSKWDSNYKWDFKDTWAINPKINGGYPYLKKMKPSAESSLKTGTWLDCAADKYAGGKGTEKSPYLIKTASQLARIAYVYRYGGGENKYFKLVNNIDLSAHSWYPIAGGKTLGYGDVYESYFCGHIDGNGKTLTGLKIDYDEKNAGFISGLLGGSVKNLNLKNAQVSGDRYVGMLCGETEAYACIYNCTVSGNVKGAEFVGGAVGENGVTVTLSGVSSTASVLSSDNVTAGGIAAINGGDIISCVYRTDEEVSDLFRGIAPWFSSGNIINCVSYGAAITDSDIINGRRILDSYYILNSEGMVYRDTNEKEYPESFTAEEMKSKNAYKGFDFEKEWTVSAERNEGYPLPVASAVTVKKEKLPTKLWKDAVASSFAGGEGTKASPYLISTAGQLVYMVYCLEYSNEYNGKYFRLTKNIDLKERLWSKSHIPLISVAEFYFDGDGKTISNLTADNGEGLFPLSLEKGEIANLNVKNVYGTPYGIISLNSGGTIRNCTVSGSLKAAVGKEQKYTHSDVGGICETNGGLIERCSVNIVGKGIGNAGGIAGYVYESSKIRNCFIKAELTGSNKGPFIGTDSYYNVKNCVAVINYKTENYDYDSSCYISGDTRRNLNMKSKKTFKKLDFDSVWAISSKKNDGYPYLRGAKERKLTYSLKGGKLSGYYKKTYTPGYLYTLPVPVRSGYAFDGWYTDSSYKKKITTVGSKDSGNIKLYAKWKKAYTLVFNSNYGKNKKVSQMIPVSAKTELTDNIFERKGYVLLGWAKSKKGEVVYEVGDAVSKLASQGKTVNLYAKWRPMRYEVSFESNGGKGTMGSMDAQKFVYGTAQYLLKCTYKPPKGKVFAGWSVNIKGVEPTYTDGEKVKNLFDGENGYTLYANWVKPEKHKISYNLNGGKMPSSYPKTYKSGTGCKLPKPTRKGYRFVGWYENPSLKGEKMTVIKPWETKNISLYAKWKKK